MKKQNFIDWIQKEIDDMEGWKTEICNTLSKEKWEILTDIKEKVESGNFDERKKSEREILLDAKFEAL